MTQDLDSVLPHTPIIREFTGMYRFLSNFYPAEITFEGVVYPTVEHAYQAAKTRDPQERARIAAAGTPGIAKRQGRQIALRESWNAEKVNIMAALLRLKFAYLPLRAKLLATGDAHLQEGNWWGDTFWGVNHINGDGKNALGKLLMELRQELRDAQ